MSDYLTLVKSSAAAALEKHLRGHLHETGSDGLARCTVCGEPLEEWNEQLQSMTPASCRCDREKQRAQQLDRARQEAQTEAMKNPLYDASYADMTFYADDKADQKASECCRAFVEHWTQMEEENGGLLFTGRIGTGKSFYAAAIVNALKEQGVSAIIVTTTRLINTVRAARDPQQVVDSLNRFRFVVLDDLGSERETGYAVEQLENFINTRYLAKRPLAVTTNLSAEELRQPQYLSYARIFDRVREMCCIPVILDGPSRRVAQGRARSLRCRQLLGLAASS